MLKRLLKSDLILRSSRNSLFYCNCVFSSEARTDDESVYGQYTPRRTDATAAENTQLRYETEFWDDLISIKAVSSFCVKYRPL